jgi:protein TonB
MTPTAAGTPRLWVDYGNTGSSPSLFAAALAIACLLHLILLLGVSFELPETTSGKPGTRSLEVVLLRQATPADEKLEIADALAQVDRAGGGVEEARDSDIEPDIEPFAELTESEPELAEPLPPPVPAPPLPTPRKTTEAQPPAPVQEETLTAVIDPEPIEPDPLLPEREALAEPTSETVPKPEPEPEPEPEPPEPVVEPPPEPATPTVTAAQILASRNLEIAQLTTRIQHNSVAYANRPRRKAISASTREYKYSNYLEAWRRKVERVGNLNYPEEAKRHKMHGNLILHAAIRADGSIERVRVLRSSGFDVLDEAAVKIVELAAPFAPFPPDIRAETDVLDITRTWQFLSNNRLGWEK